MHIMSPDIKVYIPQKQTSLYCFLVFFVAGYERNFTDPSRKSQRALHWMLCCANGV